MHRGLVAVLLAVVVAVSACGGQSRSPLLAAGRDLYTAKGCIACHGGRGEGGVGPSLAHVATTFSRCTDQLVWVELGTDRWQELHGDTYGDINRPLSGRAMPSFEGRLTDEELRTLVAYERIEFGGLTEDDVRADCKV